MSTRTKTMFIILSSVIIGIAIGALGSGMLRENRVKRFERMRPEQRFSEVMEKIIQPEGEQREAIEKVLKEQSEQIAAIQERYHSEIIAVFDSSRKALRSILTEEQRERLKEHIEKGSQQFTERRLNRLTNELQLDDQQRKQVEEIYQRRGGMFGRFHGIAETDSLEKLPDVKEAMKKLDEDIEAVLTPGQIEKFREFRQRRRPKGLDFRPPLPHRPYENN